MIWIAVVLVYLVQVCITYKYNQPVLMVLLGGLGAYLWYYISQRSDNIYLSSIIYDMIILACYLVLPAAMGWLTRMSHAEILGAIIAVIGILIIKLGG